jgi:hypothetical protein
MFLDAALNQDVVPKILAKYFLQIFSPFNPIRMQRYKNKFAKWEHLEIILFVKESN